MPIHVTLRMADHVWNLRGPRSYRVVEKALGIAANRFGVRITQFSVQGNHLHLLVEAKAWSALGCAMKGLSIRIAKGLNRIMNRSGRVVGDRYHAHVLRTPTEVRRAIDYVTNNRRKHAAAAGKHLPAGWVDPCSSDAPGLAIVLPSPSSWLLAVGWQRGAP